MLDELKTLLGPEATDDALLSLLISNAERQVKNICNREDIPEGLTSVVLSLAAIAYNRRGAEGEQSHAEGGVNRSFGADDIPASLRSEMARYRIGTVKPL